MRWTAFLPVTAVVLVVACTDGPTIVQPTPGPDGVDVLGAVKLQGGKNAKPSFVDNGLSLTASGKVSGLGNTDLFVSMSANANATSTCTNPGGNVAPGQTPPVEVTGSTEIPASDFDKNGSTSFMVSTGAPTSPVEGAPGCPNGKWEETIDDLAFINATITFVQDGATVLTVFCEFSTPTENGPVSSGNVTCTQS